MSHKQRIKQLETIHNKSNPQATKIRVIWDNDRILEDGKEYTLQEYKARYPDHVIVSWDDLPDDGYQTIKVDYETKPYSTE